MRGYENFIRPRWRVSSVFKKYRRVWGCERPAHFAIPISRNLTFPRFDNFVIYDDERGINIITAQMKNVKRWMI